MNTHLNLLPFPYRRRQLILRRLRFWSRIWGLAAIVMAGVAWHHWSQRGASEARLASLRQRHVPLMRALKESETFRQRIEELQQREVLALTLAEEPSVLNLLGQLSRAARQCDGRISIQEMKWERLEQASPGRQATGVLTLGGVATDDPTVARFTEALRDSQAFLHVELKQTSDYALGGLQARRYAVECAF